MKSRKSDILHFDGLLLFISYKVSAKKGIAELSLIALRVMLVVSNMTWKTWCFHPTTQKCENFTSMGSFCPYYMFWAKKDRGVIFHDTEHWCKTWINPDLVVSKMAWRIWWTFIRALQSLENCTLMGSFCWKHMMSQLENFRGIMCYDTEGWCNI